MESNSLKFSDDPSVTLTIRLIMQGKVSWQFIVYFFNSHLLIKSQKMWKFSHPTSTVCCKFFYDHSTWNFYTTPRARHGKLQVKIAFSEYFSFLSLFIIKVHASYVSTWCDAVKEAWRKKKSHMRDKKLIFD